MTDNVIHLQAVEAGEGRTPITAEAVLTAAAALDLDEVIVLGRTNDGVLHVSSNLDDGDMMLLIEKTKLAVLLGAMDGDE